MSAAHAAEVTAEGPTASFIVDSDGPRILLTHAGEDSVVPIESAANFCKACRDIGKDNIAFFQYSAKEAVGLNLVDGAIFNRKSESFCAIAADEEVWHHGKAGILCTRCCRKM